MAIGSRIPPEHVVVELVEQPRRQHGLPRDVLSRLLERVAAGERVVISKAGKPVAELVPHQAVDIAFGGLRGHITYDDTCLESDPEIQQMFYGRQHGDDAAS